MSLQYVDSDIGDVTVVELTGRLTLGRGTEALREVIDTVLARGRPNILLNFADVFYIDSSGLGTLVHANSLVQRAGGRLKLMKPREVARDLIQITRLYTVFEVFDDEKTALASFRN